jgi:hypothetical protein
MMTAFLTLVSIFQEQYRPLVEARVPVAKKTGLPNDDQVTEP